MKTSCTTPDRLENNPKFRRTIEERIAQLERDAVRDEAEVARLDDIDHIRRQMRLVVAERAEALRMRLLLDRAVTRPSKPAPAR
ncbi:MAG: hypothetical protein ACRD25_06375 [Terracidiphilus sp.]